MKMPKGWPTEEMYRAVYDKGCVGYFTPRESILKLFEAMLAAAPTQYPYEAACSGLRYNIPEACGNVSAIFIDGKRWPVAMDGWREAMSAAAYVIAKHAPGFSILIGNMERILEATTPTAAKRVDCGTVCLASLSDGIVCPHNSCDIEDGVRLSSTQAAQEFPTWQDAERVAELDAVSKAIRNFVDNLSGDDAIGLVQAVMGAVMPAQEVEKPIPMILYCPACHTQHIDAETDKWGNPPHRSHECQSCGHIWRPADVSTTGVAEIQTKGKFDSEPVKETMPAASDCGGCGSGECNWHGPIEECRMLGSIGPLCPECGETVEPDFAPPAQEDEHSSFQHRKYRTPPLPWSHDCKKMGYEFYAENPVYETRKLYARPQQSDELRKAAEHVRDRLMELSGQLSLTQADIKELSSLRERLRSALYF